MQNLCFKICLAWFFLLTLNIHPLLSDDQWPSLDFNDKNKTSNDLVRSILSINGVTGIFLGEDFLSVNKKEDSNWEDIKHIIISLINEFYLEGNPFIVDKDF